MFDAPASEVRTKPPCSRDDAVAVVARLRESGHVAYFAGGCVRDVLLGLEPKDYDVATDAPPTRVRQLFAQTQAVGAAFGVILVRLNRSTIEVATFRREGNYEDGRRPGEVHFTTAEEDARRRDFTINALFMDPLEEDKIIDHVGGLADVRSRTLRAVGNASERFAEDHLRLLRAVRFAARFGLNIDPATASAIGHHAPSLRRISPERIADELRLMLTPPTRHFAWPLLWRFKLADVIFRFLKKSPLPDLDEGRSLFRQTAPGEPVPFGLALASATLCTRMQTHPTTDPREFFTHSAANKSIQSMRTALKISNEEMTQAQGAIEGLSILLADAEPREALLKRFLARPTSAGTRALLAALRALDHFPDRIDRLTGRLEVLSRSDYAPAPLITGDDLAAAGLQPGPMFKRILDTLYDAQLEHQVGTKEAALTLALNLARTGQ